MLTNNCPRMPMLEKKSLSLSKGYVLEKSLKQPLLCDLESRKKLFHVSDINGSSLPFMPFITQKCNTLLPGLLGYRALDKEYLPIKYIPSSEHWNSILDDCYTQREIFLCFMSDRKLLRNVALHPNFLQFSERIFQEFKEEFKNCKNVLTSSEYIDAAAPKEKHFYGS